MHRSDNKQILCVDDCEDIRSLFRVILNHAGYETTTIASLNEGVKLAYTTDFCLYVFDLSLPDGTGFELIKKIRAFDLQTPIVVCSGQKDEGVAEQVAQAGAKAFLLKPVNIDLLVQTIDAILAENLGI